jgi:hypothetical protein
LVRPSCWQLLQTNEDLPRWASSSSGLFQVSPLMTFHCEHRLHDACEQADRQTDRQKDRQTYRQTDRQTDGQTDGRTMAHGVSRETSPNRSDPAQFEHSREDHE